MRRMTPLLLLGTLSATASSAAAGFGMPKPLTPRGEIMVEIYDKIFIAGLAFFLVVMVGLFWVVWRYREGSGFGRQTHEKHRHSTAAEVSWTVIPLAVVLWIGYISYVGLVELDEGIAPEDADMEIVIVGSQWNWEARYPGNFSVFASPDSNNGSVAPENRFIVPAGRAILLNITSVDVIHAFHIMDANRVTVGLVDANPLGDHRYNPMVIEFPEGDYPVQCREMCFNPGHAYMRAHIEAVPPAEYDLWAKERTLCAGADLCLKQAIAVGADGFDDTSAVTTVVGSRVVIDVTNTRDDEIALGLPGGGEARLGPGRQDLFAFDLEEEGTTRLSVSGPDGEFASRNYTTIVAEAKEVVLGAFRFIPDELEFEAGVQYFVTLDNQHTAPHNLYIGDYAAGTTVARSPDIAGGDTGGFLVTVEESGTYDIWCNIAGHYAQGMHGEAHVHG